MLLAGHANSNPDGDRLVALCLESTPDLVAMMLAVQQVSLCSCSRGGGTADIAAAKSGILSSFLSQIFYLNIFYLYIYVFNI